MSWILLPSALFFIYCVHVRACHYLKLMISATTSSKSTLVMNWKPFVLPVALVAKYLTSQVAPFAWASPVMSWMKSCITLQSNAMPTLLP
jgi:hypothetical protein